MTLELVDTLNKILEDHKSFCELHDKLEGKFSDEFILNMKYNNLKGQLLKLHTKSRLEFQQLEKQMEAEHGV